jgi:hypothetical protein
VPGGEPRVEGRLPWETDGPEELEAWDEESEIPAAWLPDFEAPPSETARTESPRELLERLARGAEAVLQERAENVRAPRGGPTQSASVETLQLQGTERAQSGQLEQLRRRLSSPTSLREILLLREILGPPRARRPGPFRW